MMLGVRDLERIQAAFPDLQMELVGGKVAIVIPELFPGWEIPVMELWPPDAP